MAQYHKAVRKLFELERSPHAEGPISLPMKQAAKERFGQICTGITEDLNDPGFPLKLRGTWAKFKGYTGRFALIIQLVRWACGEADCDSIDLESVDRAAKLTAYFQSHALKAHSHFKSRQGSRLASARAWIVKQGGKASARDLYTAKVAGIHSAEDAVQLMRALEDSGQATVEEVRRPTGGKPTFQIVLRDHPNKPADQ